MLEELEHAQEKRGEDIRRNRWLWSHSRCLPYYFSCRKREGAGMAMKAWP